MNTYRVWFIDDSARILNARNKDEAKSICEVDPDRPGIREIEKLNGDNNDEEEQ